MADKVILALSVFGHKVCEPYNVAELCTVFSRNATNPKRIYFFLIYQISIVTTEELTEYVSGTKNPQPKILVNSSSIKFPLCVGLSVKCLRTISRFLIS